MTDTLTVENLISWVADGKIDYTVASNDVARINRTYYANLDIDLVLSFDQRSSWAVRKTSPLLAEAADRWHRENINSPEFKASAKRYFELNKRPAHASILSVKDGKISHYDELFRKYAKLIGWDWRLLASLAYTESNFDPYVVSWAGARGLMQLMPATARNLGVPPGKEADPEESIKAGVKYIERLQKTFSKVKDEEERVKFMADSGFPEWRCSRLHENEYAYYLNNSIILFNSLTLMTPLCLHSCFPFLKIIRVGTVLTV